MSSKEGKESSLSDYAGPQNLDNPPLVVRHASLRRFSDTSDYKSCCPVCEDGLLMVWRDDKTLELKAEDYCVLCGQRVVYEDIEDLRRDLG